ncbi:Pho81p [Sugiyamaella lignohabitans]|uniref:Pho81p n=1 Tax=Sugiyamaella lignohabitans TaxID=796027 RepID=A0A167FVM0_9ASCO|nr:Pho81p [Sugiyamaella lignohabitans]ANB15755.1 Pho81p [Sugiyamaella lignohabitans]
MNILCEKKQAAYKAGALSSKSSVTYISLYEGFQRFRKDLERLEQFIELNGTGFSKVLKKWDKRSKSHTKELYLSRAVDVQPVFHREELANFSDVASSSLIELEAWSDGDNVLFEEQPGQALDVKDLPGGLREHDDLYREFVQATSTLKHNNEVQVEEFVTDFVHKLQQTKDAKERLTRIFLLAISSEADNLALAALYKSGFVDIHAVDEFSGKTCLHRAAATDNRRDLINLALSQNVDVSISDVYGKTALHYACLNNRRELIAPLLKHGADIDALDKDNFSPLLLSIVHNFAGCVEDLVNAGAKLKVDSEKDYIPLNLACQYGNYDIVKILLDKNPTVISADVEGLYPIHVVARAGLYKLVPLLKSYNIDMNELDKLNQWTALCYAASEGHYRTVRALLDAGADPTLHDDNGFSALYHAAWEGRARCTWELSRNLSGVVDTSRNVHGPGNDQSGSNIEDTLNDMELSESTELDVIPDLSLPPPIIPLQRYGHNFLDNKKIILQLLFDPSAKPINFHKDEDALPAGRLTISTRNSSDFIPRSIILPISDNDRVVTFQVESLDTFAIDFEVFSTFGTRVIAKTSVLPYVFNENKNNGSEHSCRLPMFDVRLKPVGDLSFKFQIVRPFSGKPLEITKYDTYWKSTSQVESQQPHQSVQAMSFVTASSLSGSYSQVSVCLTKDFHPVVSDSWSILVNGIEIPIGNITLENLLRLQSSGDFALSLDEIYATLSTLTDARQLHSVIKGRAIPLKDILAKLPIPIKLNICVLYPTSLEVSLSNFGLPAFAEVNAYVDHILTILFDHAREIRKVSADPVTGVGICRSLIFSSANPDVCAVLNWKQPNYPVFFYMTGFDTSGKQYRSAHGFPIEGGEDRRCVSMKDATNFAANNNLLGIICSSELLTLVPSLVPSVRAAGLVLVSDLNDTNVDIQAQDGVDGVRTHDVLIFKQTIDM